jgi:hypothetical protein
LTSIAAQTTVLPASCTGRTAFLIGALPVGCLSAAVARAVPYAFALFSVPPASNPQQPWGVWRRFCRSSKPAGRGSPPLGRFDSFAASLGDRTSPYANGRDVGPRSRCLHGRKRPCRAVSGKADASRLPSRVQRLSGDGSGSQPQRSSWAGVHAAIRHCAGGRREEVRRAGQRRVLLDGSAAGATSDKYIRGTVFLATALFLVGINGHFRIRRARLGLIGVGGCLLVFAVMQLLGLPAPP